MTQIILQDDIFLPAAIPEILENKQSTPQVVEQVRDVVAQFNVSALLNLFK